MRPGKRGRSEARASSSASASATSGNHISPGDPRRCLDRSGGRCVDLRTDSANCGACGNGLTCQNGACMMPVCPNGTLPCNGQCVDVSTDPANCGGCGALCAPSFICAGGKCTCQKGFAQCNGVC